MDKDPGLLQRIAADPAILRGKPVIKGTRLSVEFMLELMASGMAEDEILKDYPHISRDDIHACLEYAARSLKNEIVIEMKTVGSSSF